MTANTMSTADELLSVELWSVWNNLLRSLFYPPPGILFTTWTVAVSLASDQSLQDSWSCHCGPYTCFQHWLPCASNLFPSLTRVCLGIWHRFSYFSHSPVSFPLAVESSSRTVLILLAIASSAWSVDSSCCCVTCLSTCADLSRWFVKSTSMHPHVKRCPWHAGQNSGARRWIHGSSPVTFSVRDVSLFFHLSCPPRVFPCREFSVAAFILWSQTPWASLGFSINLSTSSIHHDVSHGALLACWCCGRRRHLLSVSVSQWCRFTSVRITHTMVHIWFTVVPWNAVTFAHAFILHICLEISSLNQNICQRHFNCSVWDLNCRELLITWFKTVLACVHLIIDEGHLEVWSSAVSTALESHTWCSWFADCAVDPAARQHRRLNGAICPAPWCRNRSGACPLDARVRPASLAPACCSDTLRSWWPRTHLSRSTDSCPTNPRHAEAPLRSSSCPHSQPYPCWHSRSAASHPLSTYRWVSCRCPLSSCHPARLASFRRRHPSFLPWSLPSVVVATGSCALAAPTHGSATMWDVYATYKARVCSFQRDSSHAEAWMSPVCWRMWTVLRESECEQRLHFVDVHWWIEHVSDVSQGLWCVIWHTARRQHDLAAAVDTNCISRTWWEFLCEETGGIQFWAALRESRTSNESSRTNSSLPDIFDTLSQLDSCRPSGVRNFQLNLLTLPLTLSCRVAASGKLLLRPRDKNVDIKEAALSTSSPFWSLKLLLWLQSQKQNSKQKHQAQKHIYIYDKNTIHPVSFVFVFGVAFVCFFLTGLRQ